MSSGAGSSLGSRERDTYSPYSSMSDMDVSSRGTFPPGGNTLGARGGITPQFVPELLLLQEQQQQQRQAQATQPEVPDTELVVRDIQDDQRFLERSLFGIQSEQEKQHVRMDRMQRQLNQMQQQQIEHQQQQAQATQQLIQLVREMAK